MVADFTSDVIISNFKTPGSNCRHNAGRNILITFIQSMQIVHRSISLEEWDAFNSSVPTKEESSV